MSKDAPLIPPADHEIIEEEENLRLETVWENPTEEDVVLELHKGAVPTPGKAPISDAARRGIVVFRIKAKATRAIPVEYDAGIQQTHCNEPQCSGNKPYCKDRSHRKTVVGGFGIKLVNKGMQHRPILHPALDDARARELAAKQAAREAELKMLEAQEEAERLRAELDAHKAATAATDAPAKKKQQTTQPATG